MRSEAGAEVDVIFTVVVCDKKGAVLRQLGAAHLPLDGVLAAGRDEPLGPRVVKSLDGDEVGSLTLTLTLTLTLSLTLTLTLSLTLTLTLSLTLTLTRWAA